MRATSWCLGGADVDVASLPVLEPGFYPAPDPQRPDIVAPNAWRRMSRVARFAATVAAPLATPEVALFFGTACGEYGSSVQFLRTLFQKGAAGASPLLFQNSVHNAPAGHLSIALGLRGPSETLCAGPDTVARTLERAEAWVAVHGRAALVVCADDLGAEVQQGWRYTGLVAAFSEGAAAIRIEPGDPPLPALSRRRWAWPGERLQSDPEGHDARLGLYAASDAVVVAWRVRVEEPA